MAGDGSIGTVEKERKGEAGGGQGRSSGSSGGNRFDEDGTEVVFSGNFNEKKVCFQQPYPSVIIYYKDLYTNTSLSLSLYIYICVFIRVYLLLKIYCRNF
mgnify:CR=1 FL=1